MDRKFWIFDGDVLSKRIDEAVRAEFTAPDARASASRGEVNAAQTLIFSWINIAQQKHDAQAAIIRGLVSRLDAADKELADLRADALASLSRRASRHAEHLARLEDRTRKLEGK